MSSNKPPEMVVFWYNEGGRLAEMLRPSSQRMAGPKWELTSKAHQKWWFFGTMEPRVVYIKEVVYVKYWFTINDPVSEEEGRKLWDKLAPLGANLTILLDKAYVYGDAEQYIIQRIAVMLVNTGHTVERG